MYLINTLLYDIVGPIVWYYANKRSPKYDSSNPYSHFLFKINWITGLTDFLSTMSLLYIIHRFGPYR